MQTVLRRPKRKKNKAYTRAHSIKTTTALPNRVRTYNQGVGPGGHANTYIDPLPEESQRSAGDGRAIRPYEPGAIWYVSSLKRFQLTPAVLWPGEGVCSTETACLHYTAGLLETIFVRAK